MTVDFETIKYAIEIGRADIAWELLDSCKGDSTVYGDIVPHTPAPGEHCAGMLPEYVTGKSYGYDAVMIGGKKVIDLWVKYHGQKTVRTTTRYNNVDGLEKVGYYPTESVGHITAARVETFGVHKTPATIQPTVLGRVVQSLKVENGEVVAFYELKN